MPPEASIDCVILRSEKRDLTYLYLRTDLQETVLPAELRQRLGQLTEVMRLALHPARRLAQADAATVIKQLREVGWYLQLPPP